MSYTPTTWQTGDTITAALLNKMEQGIANAGGALFVHVDFDNGTLDKTWQELHDAALIMPVVWPIEDGPYIDIYYLINISYFDNKYSCFFAKPSDHSTTVIACTADTSSSYPVIVEE